MSHLLACQPLLHCRSVSHAAVPNAVCSDVASKLRCLRVPAALALNACPDPRMLLTTLLPATHLVVDLQGKLTCLISRSQRPAGLVAAAPAVAPAIQGLGNAAGFSTPGSTASAGPPCLQGVSVQQLMEQVIPLLPAIQQHLHTALSVIRQPPTDDQDELFNGKHPAEPGSWCLLA